MIDVPRPPSPRVPLVLALGIALGVGGTLAVQSGVGEAQAGKPSKAATLERDEFHAALDLVLDRHVDPVDTRQLLASGLKHMAASLDGHSSYLTAEERELGRKREREGADAGLAVRITAGVLGDGESQALEVVSVAPGSPADQQGILPGDLLLELRGRGAARITSAAEAQILLAGAPGEVIDLELVRVASGKSRGEAIELELRAVEVDALVQGELVRSAGDTIAVVAIRSFRSGVGEQFKAELAELRRLAGGEALGGIVIDLRGNPGGEVDEALVVADLFIADGILTRTRGRGGKILREEQASVAGTDAATPLVVLQDARSASASELLAAALQDHGRATIVGEASFGKGTVQERIGLPDGSLLTLTIARYYSPNDRSIDGHPIEPDVAVADPSGPAGLDAALHVLRARE
jgi:carboxyl-terminal processing protease